MEIFNRDRLANVEDLSINPEQKIPDGDGRILDYDQKESVGMIGEEVLEALDLKNYRVKYLLAFQGSLILDILLELTKPTNTSTQKGNQRYTITDPTFFALPKGVLSTDPLYKTYKPPSDYSRFERYRKDADGRKAFYTNSGAVGGWQQCQQHEHFKGLFSKKLDNTVTAICKNADKTVFIDSIKADIMRDVRGAFLKYLALWEIAYKDSIGMDPEAEKTAILNEFQLNDYSPRGGLPMAERIGNYLTNIGILVNEMQEHGIGEMHNGAKSCLRGSAYCRDELIKLERQQDIYQKIDVMLLGKCKSLYDIFQLLKDLRDALSKEIRGKGTNSNGPRKGEGKRSSDPTHGSIISIAAIKGKSKKPKGFCNYCKSIGASKTVIQSHSDAKCSRRLTAKLKPIRPPTFRASAPLNTVVTQFIPRAPKPKGGFNPVSKGSFTPFSRKGEGKGGKKGIGKGGKDRYPHETCNSTSHNHQHHTVHKQQVNRYYSFTGKKPVIKRGDCCNESHFHSEDQRAKIECPNLLAKKLGWDISQAKRENPTYEKCLCKSFRTMVPYNAQQKN